MRLPNLIEEPWSSAVDTESPSHKKAVQDGSEPLRPRTSLTGHIVNKRKCTSQDISRRRDEKKSEEPLNLTTTQKKCRNVSDDVSAHRDAGANPKNLLTSKDNLRTQQRSAEAGSDSKPYHGQKKAPDQRWTAAEGKIVAAELERLQDEDRRTAGKRVDHSENLYERASITLRSQGINRGAASLRAYMNRKGRALHGYDERKVQKDEKSVGLQLTRSKKQRRSLEAKEEAEKTVRAVQEQFQVRGSLANKRQASNTAMQQRIASSDTQQLLKSPYPQERAVAAVQENRVEVEVEGEEEEEEETATQQAQAHDANKIVSRMRFGVQHWNSVEELNAARNAVQAAQEQAEDEQLDEQEQRVPDDNHWSRELRRF